MRNTFRSYEIVCIQRIVLYPLVKCMAHHFCMPVAICSLNLLWPVRVFAVTETIAFIVQTSLHAYYHFQCQQKKRKFQCYKLLIAILQTVKFSKLFDYTNSLRNDVVEKTNASYMWHMVC